LRTPRSWPEAGRAAAIASHASERSDRNGELPLISLIGATETPGLSMSNREERDRRSCFGAFVSVRTRQKIQSA